MKIKELWSSDQDIVEEIRDFDLPIIVLEEAVKYLDILDENYGGLEVRPTGNEDGGKVVFVDLEYDDTNAFQKLLELFRKYQLDIHNREFHDEVLVLDTCTYYIDTFVLTEYGFVFVYKYPNVD